MSRIETIGDATLYLGNCREIVPALALDRSKVALVSDPPYGKKERTNRKSSGRSNGVGRLRSDASGWAKDWPAVHGDDKPFDPAPWVIFPKVILFGANYFSSRLPDCSQWIVWDKREQTGPDDNADCEMAWTNLGGPARIHRQLWRGVCRRGEENVSRGAFRLHPTQKPIALMDFCLQACRLAKDAIVLDPYMGAGATGVAAVRRGHKFIGIELVEQYFETSLRRIASAVSEPRQANLALMDEQRSGAK